MLMLWVLGLSASQSTIDPISWQEVYLVNNTDLDLTIAADVTGLPRPTSLNYTYKTRPKHQQTWLAPKKGAKHGGVTLLAKRNKLHNLTIQPQVYNLSALPKWMQRPYPIAVGRKRPDKVLIIYVGKTDTKWLTEQRYVTSVKTVVDEGSAGYRLEIDQP